MPRRARDERLDTRTARLALPVRREPYWRNIQEGRALGYRRISGKSGSWIGRHYAAETGRQSHALGAADDYLDADGDATLTYPQAIDAARAWFSSIGRNNGRIAAPVTVSEAMAAYVQDYRARGGKALSGLETTIKAHILPKLGDRKLAELTTASIRSWHRGLATAAPRVRQSRTAGVSAKMPKPVDAADSDGQRARRSTANRILTVLKTAFNLAFADGKVTTDEAWRRVAPFKNVDSARVRFLSDAEAVRLVNAADPGFRPMIVAALLSGARYGELIRFRVADFDPDSGKLHVRTSKSGKSRDITLTGEGKEFFSQQCAGKTGKALILLRPDGEAWNKSQQSRPMRAACAAAHITPAIGFHILRHTHASRLTMAGVPLGVVAAQLGNSEAICAKHYAHLAPGYVGDTIRAASEPMGILSSSNVAIMGR